MNDQDSGVPPQGARPMLRDVDGRALGHIVEIHPTHVEVEQRTGVLGLGRRTFVIARDRIGRVEGDDWCLSIPQDELDAMVQSAHGVDPRASMTPGPPTAARTSLSAEQLEARVVPVQVGELVIRKEIVEEVRTIEVPIRREVIHIERYGITDVDAIKTQARPQDEPRGGGPWEPRAGTPDSPLEIRAETIRVQVVHEEAIVTITPRVVEEIVIVKEIRQETVVRSEPVRVERAVIEEVRFAHDEDPASEPDQEPHVGDAPAG